MMLGKAAALSGARHKGTLLQNGEQKPWCSPLLQLCPGAGRGLWGDEGLAHVSALGLVKQRVLYNASPAQRGMKYAERSCLCPPGPWEMQSGGEERK